MDQNIRDILCNVKEYLQNLSDSDRFFALKDHNHIKQHITDFKHGNESHNDTYATTTQLGQKSKVTFSPILTSGTKVGKINIDGADKIIYCNNDTKYTPAGNVPLVDGANNKTNGATGTSEKYAREDHIHPIDTSRAASVHTHGILQNNGQVGATIQASKNVVTDSYGKITTENKPIIPSASTTIPLPANTNGSAGDANTWARANHVHPTNVTFNRILNSGTRIGTIKINSTSTDIFCETHPSTHSSNIITDPNKHTNIGSNANETQSNINTKIDTALGKKVTTITGKGLSTYDFDDYYKDKLDSIAGGAKARKRVPGFHVSSPIDNTNQNSIKVNKGTKIRVILFDQEDLINGCSLADAIANRIPRTDIHYSINGGTNHLHDGDGQFTMNLPVGKYTLYLSFHGSGNYYQVYRAVEIDVYG